MSGLARASNSGRTPTQRPPSGRLQGRCARTFALVNVRACEGFVARRLVVGAELDLELHDARALDLPHPQREAGDVDLVADLGRTPELTEDETGHRVVVLVLELGP